MNYSAPFVEEIEYEDIVLLEVIGKGTFGIVKKGRWKDREVAVKLIEIDQEQRAFHSEIHQMSRVQHPNIIQLYGACQKGQFCLVMEFAECGSLYSLLHYKHRVAYNSGHAISWALQCASGISYLHNMKPKPIIHRDLKPLNLLLVQSGTILKICDFGTACDQHTEMTTTKGSASWMAPEVFESPKYSEKCDVFSWGIILWEILSRRIPFDEIGGPAFRVMWAVHDGTRPPLLQGCPKPIENIMTRSWARNPNDRPSMSEIEEDLTVIAQYFPGGDEPLIFYSGYADDSEKTEEFGSSFDTEFMMVTPQEIKNDLSIKSLPKEHIGQHRRTHSEGSNATSINKTLPSTSASSGSITYSYQMLDPSLQPIPPAMFCSESIAIFEAHKALASEYLRVHTEIDLLTERKHELVKEIKEDTQQTDLEEEYTKLLKEKDSLLQLRDSLTRQIELKKKMNQDPKGGENGDEWVVVW